MPVIAVPVLQGCSGGDRIYEKPESSESYGCGFRTGGEAMNGRGEHVRHRVSLVLELWDDFTDRPISDPSVMITAPADQTTPEGRGVLCVCKLSDAGACGDPLRTV